MESNNSHCFNCKYSLYVVYDYNLLFFLNFDHITFKRKLSLKACRIEYMEMIANESRTSLFKYFVYFSKSIKRTQSMCISVGRSCSFTFPAQLPPNCISISK